MITGTHPLTLASQISNAVEAACGVAQNTKTYKEDNQEVIEIEQTVRMTRTFDQHPWKIRIWDNELSKFGLTDRLIWGDEFVLTVVVAYVLWLLIQSDDYLGI